MHRSCDLLYRPAFVESWSSQALKDAAVTTPSKSGAAPRKTGVNGKK
jgi:hypothetical protein